MNKKISSVNRVCPDCYIKHGVKQRVIFNKIFDCYECLICGWEGKPNTKRFY